MAIKSIDGFDVFEVYEVNTNEVVRHFDHEQLAKWAAEDLTEDHEHLGRVYATRPAGNSHVHPVFQPILAAISTRVIS